jgi:Cephalosporin hydroxylase
LKAITVDGPSVAVHSGIDSTLTVNYEQRVTSRGPLSSQEVFDAYHRWHYDTRERTTDFWRGHTRPAIGFLHVLAELSLLCPLLVTGDDLVVEDSNINGHPVLPAWGRGPYEAIAEYERLHPDDYRHDTESEAKFGFTFAPNGFLIRR